MLMTFTLSSPESAGPVNFLTKRVSPRFGLSPRRTVSFSSSPVDGSVTIQSLAHAKKRRSTRIDQSIPLTVGGADAFRAPYLEHVSTVTVSCHGCRYQSKYDVLPGDVVFLELSKPDQERETYTTRAHVKCIERMVNTDRPFEIAVELEAPGNIWGVAFPPEDWFPAQKVELTEPANHGQEQPALTETKPPRVAIAKEKLGQVSQVARNDTALPLSPLLAQLVAGLGEQIQQMASEAATTAILKEKRRLLEDFRVQLQREAARTLGQVISTSQEELTRRALDDLNKAHETAARTTHERWMKQVEQDIAIATEGMIAQGNELSQRVEGMAASTIERLQRHMEALRRDSVDHFLARLREQLAPVLENAQSTLQRLAAYDHELKEKSEASCVLVEGLLEQTAQRSVKETQEKMLQFEKQFESGIGERLAKAHEELDRECAIAVAESTENVRKLSQECQSTAGSYLQSLVAQTADQVKNALREKTAEISREFAGDLEATTRSYFESINELIAEIPKKTGIRIRSRD